MAKIAFTAGRVAAFSCPPEKTQAFLWDITTNGLGLRATPTGKPSYVFQSEYQGKSLRLTIGKPAAWSIEQARTKARDLQRMIDDGNDPRDLKRDALAAKAERQAAEAAEVRSAALAGVTMQSWSAYLEARRAHWGDRHYDDHLKLTRAGGEKTNRGTRGRGVTVAMPLHALMALPLRDLTAPTIEAWAAREAKTRPTNARLAWRCLKAFLNWCVEQPEYAGVMPVANPAKTRKAREALGKASVKQDALLREQLPAWFTAVRNMGNPTISAYLQTLLITGARPGEVMSLRWEDLDIRWRGLTIRDKVEGERVIPLTPYVHHLLAALPRRNGFVFASNPRGGAKVAGPIASPNVALTKASNLAGVQGLTLHGLRRSFKSLTEWLEIPAGVVAQIMGHKPSATAEKHYTVRPLDLLRVHHERIEAWLLEQAGVSYTPSTPPAAVAKTVPLD
jgi:integrase